MTTIPEKILGLGGLEHDEILKDSQKSVSDSDFDRDSEDALEAIDELNEILDLPELNTIQMQIRHEREKDDDEPAVNEGNLDEGKRGFIDDDDEDEDLTALREAQAKLNAKRFGDVKNLNIIDGQLSEIAESEELDALGRTIGTKYGQTQRTMAAGQTIRTDN